MNFKEQQRKEEKLQGLEDKLGNTKKRNGAARGAEVGLLIDAACGGALLGIPTALGTLVGMACTAADQEDLAESICSLKKEIEDLKKERHRPGFSEDIKISQLKSQKEQQEEKHEKAMGAIDHDKEELTCILKQVSHQQGQ